MRRHVLVYTTTALVALGLVCGAIVYARQSQAGLERMRVDSVNGAAEHDTRSKVKVVRVFEQALTDVLRLPGSVEAYEDVDLAVRMGGTVEWLELREGDRVKAGQTLLHLDVAAEEAQLAQAQAAYDLALSTYDRAKGLYEKEVVAVRELDDARGTLRTAKAALDAAKVYVDYGTLISPIDGVVDRLPVDCGEHVAEGETVMKIVDIARVEVVLDVPEKDVVFFKSGQAATIFLSNGKERVFEGVVGSVALTADPASRTYPMKVVVDNAEGLLRPGMIVRAELVRRELDRAIAVPFFTIVDLENSKAVFVVEDGVARLRPIVYGIFRNGLVEIVEGLRVGDALIVVGHRNLVNGEKVEIAEDLTEPAKAILAAGGDLSKIAMELGIGN